MSINGLSLSMWVCVSACRSNRLLARVGHLLRLPFAPKAAKPLSLCATLLSATIAASAADVESPTATVGLEADFLSSTSSSTKLTITFSEDPVGFDEGDLILSNGSITAGSYDSSNFTYTAFFTADSNVDATGGVELVAGSYEDAAGNIGGGSSDTADIDTQNPTSTISFDGSLLSSVSDTTTVTIAFSEDPVGFDETDLVVSNGILSGFSGQGTVWTATFEAASNFAGDGGVQLPGGSYTDHVDFQNPGEGSSGSISIDTFNPTVTVNIVESVLTDSNSTSLVTFEFSEDVTGFDVNDVTSTFGSISGFTVVDASNYQATFTAQDGVDVVGQVAVVADYEDLAGNTGTSGVDTVFIDRLNPTVNVDVFENELTDAEPNSLVTFEFSEDVVGFDQTDLTPANGVLFWFSGTGSSYQATFTADDGVDGVGSVTVGTGYTDLLGNTGNGGSDTVTIDTENPTATVDLAATSLSDSNNSTVLTITFSEVPLGFDAGTDLTVTGGALGAGSFDASNKIWTATYTANDGITGTGSVFLASGSYTDAAGNAGIGASDSLNIDTGNPPTTPSAPTATPGNGQATVTWSKPADGGSTITGYTVTSSPGGQTCSTNDADTLSCVVTGLTNGTAYTFTVTATNGVGTSTSSSASNSVTPAEPAQAAPSVPVPTLPTFLLLALGGLLALFGIVGVRASN